MVGQERRGEVRVKYRKGVASKIKERRGEEWEVQLGDGNGVRVRETRRTRAT